MSATVKTGAAKSTRPKRANGSTDKGGRPPIKITDDMRQQVAALASVGTPQEIIGRIVGVSVDTLDRHFRAELDTGIDAANAQVAATLFRKAIAGDNTAIIWWEKTRAGKREITRLEHSGVDGKPIELKDLSGLSDEQLDLIERAAVALAGRSVAGTGDQPEADPR